ncbi:unnamed protein product [Durusdinium trenchii]|uniref:Uncharacterized protein n=1 Tax=Durusdinium trenchii TaxID=1381693 RepID=A0ABP0M3Q4_9DINO
MTLTDPELLRATVPSKALRFFGRALREKSFDREIYHLSSTTEKVAACVPTCWVCGDLLVARLKVGETYFSIVAGVVLLGCLG